MKHTFLRAALLFIHASGFCSAAGIITGEDVRGVKGESVTFATSLEPSAESFLALTWSFNRTTNIITSTSTDVVGKGYESRIALNKQTGSLLLSNLTEEDSGEYELIIFPYGGQQLQGSATLKVLTLVSKPSVSCPDPVLIEGQSVKLTCDADSFVSRVWTKDGKAVVSGDRFSFHDGNRVLSISPLDRRDSGEFTCSVSNDLSSESDKCNLHIYYGPDTPTVLQLPAKAELEERVRLICSADSLPEATFYWTFKSTTIRSHIYHIDELEEEHLGRYTCTARNAVTGREALVSHRLRGR
eukprot:XP_011604276.1 PREDICTED: carcinoembryonic antigen-related cell adhesion molecule 1-like [Takifugu rubripes]